MKKTLIAVLIVVLLLNMTACGSKTENKETAAETTVETTATSGGQTAEGDTYGAKYLAAFNATESTEAYDVADELTMLEAFPSEMVQMSVNPGFLNGFTAEITGFTAGEMFSPMISSIPCVGYVFETEDPEALLKLLNENADPRWNVCTEADETVSGSKGNLVFFMMVSNEEE